MGVKKFRWSRVYESTEEELLAIFENRHIQTTKLTDEPTQSISDNGCNIWCSEGSLTVVTATQSVALQAGDGLRIDAFVPYELQPGFMGYTCYLSD